MNRRLGFIYVVLVVLVLIMGAWWLYFLSNLGNDRAEFELQKLASDKLHATFLIQSDAQVRQDPEKWLGSSFPDLLFQKTAGGVEVVIDPEAVRTIGKEARATRNMFLYEGFFLLLLLMAASTILYLSWRSEVKYKETRELFLSGATHEFKTPLASLRLYTETLGREGLGDEDRTRIRSRMIEDLTRLEFLVDEVLSMSADDTFAQGPQIQLDLSVECRQVLNDLKDLALDHQAEFKLEAPDQALVLGRRLTFHLALRNLLVNAVMHSDEPVQVLVTVTPGAKWHRMKVTDNGPGIPRRLHEKVFECFYSRGLNNGNPGAGVGLHLVRRNIEAMGGRTELESEEGAGCTFTLVLPALKAGGG